MGRSSSRVRLPTQHAVDSLRLTDEERERAIGAIRAYFERERDEEIGELAAGLLLDFVGEQLGPYFFNRGIEDAQARVVRASPTRSMPTSRRRSASQSRAASRSELRHPR